MSGYLDQTRLTPVNEKFNWNTVAGNTANLKVSSDPWCKTESLLSYRTGPWYERAIAEGATPRVDLDRYLVKPRKGDKIRDYGNMFDHRKVTMTSTHPRVDLSSSTNRFLGPLLLGPVNASALPYNYLGSGTNGVQSYSDGDLNILGAQGVASANPTKPQADLMVAIAELIREGLPTHVFSALSGYRGNSFRRMAGEGAGDFLNLIFGVSPILREIDKILKVVAKTDTLIQQLVADSGNVVRRSRTVIDETKLLNVQYSSVYASLQGANIATTTYGLNNKVTRVQTTQTLSKRVWFAGAFQYWIPNLLDSGTDFQSFRPGDWKGIADVSRLIYGLQFTPKAAWNLLPFSWLVDWFVNVSVLLDNADMMNQYGLVMPYGYVMAEMKLATTTSTDFSGTNLRKLGWAGSTVLFTVQKRRPANPYGFGLKDVDLNPVQWSILAALGLSSQRNR